MPEGKQLSLTVLEKFSGLAASQQLEVAKPSCNRNQESAIYHNNLIESRLYS